MISVSGCFGNGVPSYEQLDTAAEAAAVVDQLQQMEQPTDTIDPTATAVVQLSVAYEAMARRVRLLSWAVVLFAIYIIAKEF